MSADECDWAASGAPGTTHRQEEMPTRGCVWVGVPPRSPGSMQCQHEFAHELEKPDWTWQGYCTACVQHFARGTEAGSCEHSSPKPLAGAELWNDWDLWWVMGDIGVVALLVYLEGVGWSYNEKWRSLGENGVCPRCRALYKWCEKWYADQRKRLKCVNRSLCEGAAILQEAVDVGYATDILLSHRFRRLLLQVGRLRLRGGVSTRRIAVVVQTGLSCYILWHLLCVLHRAWRRDDCEEPPRSLEELLARPSDSKHCARIDTSAMKPSELERALQDVQELQVPIVVVRPECLKADGQLPDLGPISYVIAWDDEVSVPESLASARTKVIRFYLNGSEEDEEEEDEEDEELEEPMTPPPGLDCVEYEADASPEEQPEETYAEEESLVVLAPEAPRGPCMPQDPSRQDHILILERAWLACAPDSYAAAALRDKGIVKVDEVETDRCVEFVATVRPLGHLAPVEPSTSATCSSPETAKAMAASRGVELWREQRLLDEDGRVAESFGALSLRLAPLAPLVPSAPVRRPSARLPPSWEPELLGFSQLHDVDLADPCCAWPAEMRVLRIDLARGGPGSGEFGLLVAPPAEERMHHGISLECPGSGDVVRLTPVPISWAAMRAEPDCPPSTQPESLLRTYHEAMVHSLVPTCKPPALQTEGRTPTAALLVRLAPEAEGVRFAWQEMLDVRQRALTDLLDQACLAGDDEDTAEDDQSPTSEAARLEEARRQAASVRDLFVDEAPLAAGEGDEVRAWLPSVLHRWYRLYDLEAAAGRLSPIFPALSPVALEAVLTTPSTGRRDVLFDSYQALGGKVVRVLLATIAHCRTVVAEPAGSHHMHFARTLAALTTRERLAQRVSDPAVLPPGLLRAATGELHARHWAPPGVRCRDPFDAPAPPLQAGEEALAAIAEAFIGAYFSSVGQEGNFFSPWQFLMWPVRSEARVEAPWERAALGHLLFGNARPYRGRTPSYLEFYEQSAPEWNDRTLSVHYADGGEDYWVEYRRARPGVGESHPMERRKDAEERKKDQKWTPLFFHPRHQTFVSTALGPVTDQDVSSKVVPNKVCSWILGRPIAPLVTVKPFTTRAAQSRTAVAPQEAQSFVTSDYVQLQEREAGLHVKYREHGWFVYARSEDGNLGTERKATRKVGENLWFSERLKTLRSVDPELLERPLPNKITEWLHHQKCIAFIVTPKRCDTEAGKEVDLRSMMERTEEKAVYWRFDSSERFECHLRHASGGILFVERVSGTETETPLIYSEELKTWLSPTLTARFESQWPSGAPVPHLVLDWLKQTTQRVLREPGFMDSRRFRQQYFKAPWCTVPHFVKMMVPRSIELTDLELQTLDYSFRNPMLLVEALTHASFSKATCPPNARLAILGSALVELLLTQELLQRLQAPLHGTWNPGPWAPEAEGDRAEPRRRVEGCAFAVAAAEGEGFPGWPPAPPGRPESSAAVLRRLNACCNHVTYAHVCCQSQIYKSLLHDGHGQALAALGEAIREFAKVSKLAARGSTAEFWQILSTHDAPRILSDALLAVIAAVFLDSDWLSCAKVFQRLFGDLISKICDAEGLSALDPVANLQHLAAREGLAAEMHPVDGHSGDANLRIAALSAACYPEAYDAIRGRAFCHTALALGRPGGVCEGSGGDDAARWAFAPPDLHFCSLRFGGCAIGPPVGATSPRSAARRCAALVLGDGGGLTVEALRVVKWALDCNQTREDIMDRLEQMRVLHRAKSGLYVVQAPLNVHKLFEGTSADSASERGDDESARQVRTLGGAAEVKWCEDCQVWLNGPSQWEDHKIGKKHRKKTQKKILGAKDATPTGKPLDDPGKAASRSTATPLQVSSDRPPADDADSALASSRPGSFGMGAPLLPATVRAEEAFAQEAALAQRNFESGQMYNAAYMGPDAYGQVDPMLQWASGWPPCYPSHWSQ